MVLKPGKVLCCMFLLAILGVDQAQNLAKIQKVVCVFIQLANSSLSQALGSWAPARKKWASERNRED